jgi:hypothetical protein
LLDWPAHVPSHLLERAYRVGSEFAWPRDDAVEVVSALRRHHFVVVGVDIWLPTHPGPTIPTPYIYDWSLRSDHASPGYAVSAVEFIRNFKWARDDESHQGLEPYFNLTVAPLST